MRDIEYRAWDAVRKEMITLLDTSEGYIYLKALTHISNDFYIPMQFTGLLDAKGNKVFEGDLIKNERGRTAKVVWHEWTASFDCEFVGDECKDPVIDKSFGFKNHQWCTSVEIIGNIYQHPHLIKGGE